MFKILLCDSTLTHLVDSEFNSYDVDIAQSMDEIYDLTFKKKYHLYIANTYYYEAFKNLKKSDDDTYTIFVDEYYSLQNLKIAFLIGDDYLAKPLSYEELKIRVDYCYRKNFNQNKDILIYNEFYYHIHTKQLYKENERIKLSPSETKLLAIFLFQVDKNISKYEILENLDSSSDGTLRVYISRLNKLGFNIVYERVTKTYRLNKKKR